MKVVILSLLLVALIVSAEAGLGPKRKAMAKKCKAECGSACSGMALLKLKRPCKTFCTGAPMNLFSDACANCASRNGEGDCYNCMTACAKTAIMKFKKKLMEINR